MSSAERVLFVTSDAETAVAVSAALETIGHFAPDGVCRDLQELVAHLEREPATGVLVDIDPDPERILADLDPITARFSDVRFIILSSAQRSELVIEAMRAGARHFLLKQSLAPQLADALERMIPADSKAAHKQGSVVTVLSAGGGCGATTLSINLANELYLARSEPVLLVDLDCCYGAVGAYLGLEGQYGIDDVLADRERIDPQLINSTAVVYSEGLQALLSPATTKTDEPALQYDNLGCALEACKRAYAYAVVDAPRVSMAVSASLARASQLTLIVFQLNVKDIRRTRRLLTVLADQGVPAERMMPLANRYRKRYSMINDKEMEAALGGIPHTRISNDFRNALRGMNFGQPLAQAAPRSALRRDITQLATKVVEACSNHTKHLGEQ